MLSLTRKSDYALVALSLLGQRKLAGDGPISARAVAEAFNLPQPLLMNILKELAQAKIVTSTRGATGGYELAIEPSKITVLEVITAIEGPVKLAQCCEGLPVVGQQPCAVDAATCPAKGAVRKLHNRIVSFFNEMSLDELLKDAEEAAENDNATETGPCCMSLTVGEVDITAEPSE